MLVDAAREQIFTTSGVTYRQITSRLPVSVAFSFRIPVCRMNLALYC